MADIALEVRDELAEMVGRLRGGSLEADDVALDPVLRWNVERVGEEVQGLSQCADPINPEVLRQLAKRLETLADVNEAVR
jgi:hypothetical protein